MYELQATLACYARRKFSAGEISTEHMKNVMKVIHVVFINSSISSCPRKDISFYVFYQIECFLLHFNFTIWQFQWNYYRIIIEVFVQGLIIISLCQEVKKYLIECIQIFSFEPACLQEGRLATIARLDLLELETFLDSLDSKSWVWWCYKKLCLSEMKLKQIYYISNLQRIGGILLTFV